MAGIVSVQRETISITFIYSWNTGYCLNEESHNWCQYVTRGKTSQYGSPQLLQCLDGFPEWSQKSKLLLSFVHPTLYLYFYYGAATKVLPYPVLYNNISTPNLTPTIEHIINEWWSFPRMNRVTQQGTQTLSFFVLLWFSFWLYNWLLGLQTGAIALRETPAALFGQL